MSKAKLFVSVLLLVVLLASLIPLPVQAQSWLTGYTYRQQMSLSRSSGAVTNYQMRYLVYKTTGTSSDSTIYLNNHALSWTGTVPDDLRFTKSDGSTQLDYWIESSDANQAYVWVEFDSIGTSATYFYVYYGKSSDTTTSNIVNTFLFADDFDDGALDAKWNDKVGTITETDGYVQLDSGETIRASGSSYTSNYRVKFNFKASAKVDNRGGGLSNSAAASSYIADDSIAWGAWGNGLYKATSNDASLTSTFVEDWSINTLYRLEFTFDGTTVTYYKNETSKGTQTTNAPNEACSPRFTHESIAGITYYDWFFVANWQSTEPTIGSYGSEEMPSPSVTTNVATSVEATTATLSGNVTAINDTNITDRGFEWDTDTGAPYTNSWTETGTFSTGTFTHGITGLSAGTTYYFRAKAKNSNGSWGYGSELTLLTKPAAPTGVSATDGTDTTKVVVTWTKSTGATDYQVYRDGTALGWLGDVATYDDAGAGAPTLTVGTATACDGCSQAYVTLSIAGESANNGTTHTYKVKAKNATGESDYSGTDTGYRGVGTLTYQWYRSAGDSDGSYSEISGATTDPYNDTGGVVYPDGRYYKCYLSATGVTSDYTNADRGYKVTWVVPTVTTLQCSGSGGDWAVLNGIINVQGDAAVTQIGFDYGLTTSYGSSITKSGTWNTGDAFKLTVTGLQPATPYYFRAKAYNEVWGYGAPNTFSTQGSPQLYEYLNTGGDASSANITGNTWAYQTFTTGTTAHTITSVRLKLKRTGSPSTVTVGIRHATADASAPTGLELVTAELNGTAFSTDYTWYEFAFDTTYSLEALEQYAIVVRAVSGTATDYINWQVITAGSMANAVYGTSTDGGISWTSGSPKDALFEIWGYPCLRVISANVYNSYVQSGDWLIVANTENTYPPYYNDNADPSSYFMVQLVDASGNVLAATPVKYWERQPIGIYLQPSMVTGLTWAGGYYIRIRLVNDTAYQEYALQSADWKGTELTYLDQWIRMTAIDLQTYYGASYLVSTADKGLVLNEAGGVIFSRGIPALADVRPNMFLTAVTSLIYTAEDWDKTYEASRSDWQANIGTGLTNLFTKVAPAMGMAGDEKTLAGLAFVAIYLVIGLVLSFGGSGWVGIIMAIPLVLAISWLGLLSMSVVFAIGIALAVLFVRQIWWSST